jgi:hypothetical protein
MELSKNLRREGGEEGRMAGSHGRQSRQSGSHRRRSVAVIANFLQRKRKRKTPLPMYNNTWTQFNPNLYYIKKISNFQQRKFQKYQGK